MQSAYRRSVIGAAVCCLWLAACACPCALPALSDDAAAQGREILAKSEQAVVSVRVVAKIRVAMEGREVNEEENTEELIATIIDPTGLAVCSLSEADPSHMIDMMMDEESGVKWEAQIADIKMRLPDGKELSATIVLRDKDLDLAFIRPTEQPSDPLPSVDFSNDAQADTLDEIIVLGRLGQIANRAASASLDRIEAIITKPRKLYVPGIATMAGGLGRPVFALDGRAVGLLVMRSIPGASRALEDSRGSNMLPVILPAADILEVAKQVPQ